MQAIITIAAHILSGAAGGAGVLLLLAWLIWRDEQRDARQAEQLLALLLRDKTDDELLDEQIAAELEQIEQIESGYWCGFCQAVHYEPCEARI